MNEHNGIDLLKKCVENMKKLRQSVDIDALELFDLITATLVFATSLIEGPLIIGGQEIANNLQESVTPIKDFSITVQGAPNYKGQTTMFLVNETIINIDLLQAVFSLLETTKGQKTNTATRATITSANEIIGDVLATLEKRLRALQTPPSQ